MRLSLLSHLSSFGAVFCICCLSLAPIHARAEAFTLHYAMYAGGFQAMSLAIDFDFTNNKSTSSYAVKMNAQPYGLLGHILPWAGEYKTNGIFEKNLAYPVSHTTISRWREDHDSYFMTFRHKEFVSGHKIEKEDGTTKETKITVDPSFYTGAVDIVTASIRAMQHLQDANDCTSSSFVFDGKRRFQLKFSALGKEQLTKSRYNMFNGSTSLCQVEMIPLLGYKNKPTGYYKIQEAARARGQLPRVWFGAAWSNGRPVPVKMLLKSEYGAVFVHLEKITRATR